MRGDQPREREPGHALDIDWRETASAVKNGQAYRHELLCGLEDSFRQTFRTMRREFSRMLGDELTGNEFMYMNYLQLNGPQIISAMAEEMGFSNSHTTAVIDRLEKKAWVRRQRSESDRRVVQVHLTGTGETILKKWDVKRTAYMMKRFDKLTDEEMRTLLTLFNKLQE